MNRIFLIVLDSVGIGALPDAAAFGDEGANTLGHIAPEPAFSADTMGTMGLGLVEGVSYIGAPKGETGPIAAYGRCMERSKGKDTTVGHWEIAGLVSARPLPTYPNGFPKEVLAPFERITGRGVLCNRPYSGTDAIRDYGEAHMLTGDLIVYTSADSVFQIAAHESVVPPETLYAYCRAARRILTDVHSVGRVIARPFIGEPGSFARTSNRRDFSLEPPSPTMLDAIRGEGLHTIAVGKITDIFAARGVTRSVYTHSNEEGMAALTRLAGEDFCGLCFANLVDFDSLWGHRNVPDKYAAGIAAFDAWLPSFLEKLQEDDMLIITADHGCDPTDASTDHTREYTPLLVYGAHVSPVSLGTRETFADIGATVTEALGVPFACAGKSFLSDILMKK